MVDRRGGSVVVVRRTFGRQLFRQASRLARPGWWRSWPPVPVPTDGLWRMRMLTAYGGDGSGLCQTPGRCDLSTSTGASRGRAQSLGTR